MKIELMRSVPLFAGLSPEEEERVAQVMQPQQHPQGASLFKQGEPCDALLMVQSGYVRLLGENNITLATLGAGSVLSEAEFLRGLNHTTSAVTASEVALLSLKDEALRSVIKQAPEIGLKLSSYFGEQIAQMEEYLVERLADTSVLGDLPRNVLRTLARRLRPRQVRAGEALYEAGQHPQGLFLVESGSLVAAGETDQAPERMVQSGELLGVLSLLTNKPHALTVRAAAPSLVWVLSTGDFYRLGSEHPILRRTLGRRVRSRLSQADQTQAIIRLAQSPIFAKMTPDHLRAIAERLVLQHVPAGEPVYRRGEAGDALYLVDAGEVEIAAENPAGVVEELDRVQPGGFFGEMSLLTGRNRTDNAIATRDTNLWVLYKADLDELVGMDPNIGAILNQVVAARLAAQDESIDEQRYRRFPLLANLSGHDLREVVRHLHPTRFRAGEQIFRAGTPGDALFFIERGQVRIQPLSGGHGWVLREGELFGERSVLTNQLRGQSAFAETEVDLLVIGREELEALMMRLPTLSLSLSRLLSQQLEQPGAPAPQFAAEGAQQQAPIPPAPTLSAQRRRAAAYRQPVEPVESSGGLGAWFAGLSTGAKLRLALLIVLLIYLIAVAAPYAVRTLFAGPTVASNTQVTAAGISTNVRGAVSPGENAVAAMPAQGESQLVALANPGAQPTATYTPYPTNTPLPTATPTVTPTPTDTPVPTATPTFTPVPPTPVPVVVQQEPEPEAQAAAVAPALPPRAWDGRLDALGVGVVDAPVSSGQPYWRLIEAKWENEQEAGGKHHIYVEVLDESGKRIVGQPVTVFWPGGSDTGVTEDKNPPDYAYNYPMYKAGNSYNVKIEGLPSDVVQGMGLGTPEQRFYTIHTTFKLIFQRTIAP